MQLQTQVGRQDEPPRHFLLLAIGGHGRGQPFEQLLAKQPLEELPLIRFADDLQRVELSAPQGVQYPLRMMLDDL